jgi:hypothetical protein
MAVQPLHRKWGKCQYVIPEERVIAVQPLQ